MLHQRGRGGQACCNFYVQYVEKFSTLDTNIPVNLSEFS